MLSCSWCGARSETEFELLGVKTPPGGEWSIERWWHRWGCGRPVVLARNLSVGETYALQPAAIPAGTKSAPAPVPVRQPAGASSARGAPAVPVSGPALHDDARSVTAVPAAAAAATAVPAGATAVSTSSALATFRSVVSPRRGRSTRPDASRVEPAPGSPPPAAPDSCSAPTSERPAPEASVGVGDALTVAATSRGELVGYRWPRPPAGDTGARPPVLFSFNTIGTRAAGPEVGSGGEPPTPVQGAVDPPEPDAEAASDGPDDAAPGSEVTGSEAAPSRLEGASPQPDPVASDAEGSAHEPAPSGPEAPGSAADAASAERGAAGAPPEPDGAPAESEAAERTDDRFGERARRRRAQAMRRPTSIPVAGRAVVAPAAREVDLTRRAPVAVAGRRAETRSDAAAEQAPADMEATAAEDAASSGAAEAATGSSEGGSRSSGSEDAVPAGAPRSERGSGRPKRRN